MTFSKVGRIFTALVATAALGLGMTACGGGTIGYIWVLGTYYSQISGYKIDDYTGNLTPILDSPFSSGGSNPQSIVVKAGGRFVYVINSGTGEVSTPNSGVYQAPSGASISEFSVGGGGTLVFQQSFQSQGFHPLWAVTDSSGSYLYVLDRYSPAYCATATCANLQDTTNTSAKTLTQDLNGSLTTFAIAADTGKLTLVTNAAVLQPGTNIPTTYFEVGPNPVMVQQGGGGCLFTLSPTSIYPYAVGSSGQLTVTQTGSYVVPSQGSLTPNFTSINTGNSTYTYLTDAANNYIYALQAGGTTCSLTAVGAGSTANLAGTSNPVNSVTAPSGKYLYVINQNTNGVNPGTQTANSSISAFSINQSGQLTSLADGTNNPYAVGSVPVCIAVDPTKQYLYISNNADSTLTGKLVDQNRGFLANLNRGSVFTVSKNPSCLAISGNI